MIMKYLNLNVNLSVNLINVNQFLAYLTAPDMQMKKLFFIEISLQPSGLLQLWHCCQQMNLEYKKSCF